MAIVVPEIVIQNTLDSILALIKADWTANVTKSNTILYKLWYGVSRGTFNFYEQAQTIMLAVDTDPRKLVVKPAYPQNESDFPCIIVNVPSESTGSVNGLGFDENIDGAFFNDDDVESTDTHSRSFDFTYSIMIFSDNREETILIYNTLKAMFVALQQHLAFSGIENLKISGRELQLMPSSGAPKNTYVRALNLSGFSQLTVQDIAANAMVQEFTFDQTVLEDE